MPIRPARHGLRAGAFRHRLLVVLCFVLPVIASGVPCFGDRMVSVDVGYFGTTSSKFGNGPVYGLGLTEGSGKIGFGITALRFANTYTGDTTTVTPQGKPYTTDLEETVNDFVITILATYRLADAKKAHRLLLGAGPQIHLVNSEIQIGDIKMSARSSRLALGLLFRYHRRIEMFGETAFVVTGTYSYVQDVASHTDQYEPPRESLSLATMTVGLAFPF
jgi:hypothetical protein